MLLLFILRIYFEITKVDRVNLRYLAPVDVLNLILGISLLLVVMIEMTLLWGCWLPSSLEGGLLILGIRL